MAGPRIDEQLASVDRSLGIHWTTIMTFAADHPLTPEILSLAYGRFLPQTLFLVTLLGWNQKQRMIYGLCLAISAGAFATIAVWTAFPSFGAYSVYQLSPLVAAKLHLVENGSYGQQLTEMLRNGPGFILPKDLRGIIGFHHITRFEQSFWRGISTAFRT